MSPLFFTLPLITAVICLTGCDSSKENLTPTRPTETAAPVESPPDIPILPLTEGDHWIYRVHLEIPAGITSPSAAELDSHHPLTRTYLGKISPAEGLPRVDCFEVVAPALPVEREFVDIHPDSILMRGSMLMRPETTHPMWLDPPVPLIIAGMKPGSESPEIKALSGGLSRKTQIIARETVTVPAGTFPSIRLLMTGMDGELELRRTLWFTPRIGIVREEKIRHRLGKLIFRETHELTETNLHPAAPPP